MVTFCFGWVGLLWKYCWVHIWCVWAFQASFGFQGWRPVTFQNGLPAEACRLHIKSRNLRYPLAPKDPKIEYFGFGNKKLQYRTPSIDCYWVGAVPKLFALLRREDLPSPLHIFNSQIRSLAWTPKVCKIMAFMAIILGLGLLFYILLGFR